MSILSSERIIGNSKRERDLKAKMFFTGKYVLKPGMEAGALKPKTFFWRGMVIFWDNTLWSCLY